MRTRPDGFDQSDFAAAFERVAGWQSLEEIDRDVDAIPVLSSPIFHAYIRQARNEGEFAKHDAYFNEKYRCLFGLLQGRAHRILEVDRDFRFAEETAVPWIPEFFAELILSSNADMFPQDSWYSLPNEVDMLIQHVERESGCRWKSNYEPTPGISWNVCSVRCFLCNHQRLSAKAHWVDLVAAPELVHAVRDQKLNHCACPHCGGFHADPLRLVAAEAPTPADLLAFQSSAYRLETDWLVYLPPAGFTRQSRLDRVHEIRMACLLEDLGEDRLGRVTRMQVSYSLSELAALVEEFESENSAEGVPLQLMMFVEELDRKLASGELSYADALRGIDHILGVVGDEWPLILQPPGETLLHPRRGLLVGLIAEGIARRQERPLSLRAGLAGSTAQGFAVMGEYALAEAALARAIELIAETEETEPRVNLVRASLMNVQAELANRRGQHDLASDGFAASTEAMGSESVIGKFVALQIRSNAVLATQAQDHRVETIRKFVSLLSDIRTLRSQIPGDDLDTHSALDHCQSGVTANYARALGEVYDALRRFEVLSVDPSREQMDEFALWFRSSPERMKLVSEMGDVLGEFPHFTSPLLAREVERLYLEALEIAEGIGAHDYMAVQTYNLGALYDDLGAHEEAHVLYERSERSARQVGDRERLVYALAAQAAFELKRENGPVAATQLQDAIRQALRLTIVGSPLSPRLLNALVSEAFRATTCGAKLAESIALAESVRANTTAWALRYDPTALTRHDGGGGARLTALRKRREELRAELANTPIYAESLQPMIADVESEIESTRRRLSTRNPAFTRYHDATFEEPLTVEETRHLIERCGAKSTLIGVWPGAGELWVYALWNDGKIIERLTGRESESILALLAGCEGPDDWGPTALSQAGEALLRPLESRLRTLDPSDLVLVSASDDLGFLPWAALPLDGLPLVQRTTLTFTLSLGLLGVGAERSANVPQSSLILGAPYRPDAEELIFSLEEATQHGEFLRTLHVHTDVRVGREATALAVVERAAELDLLHFACHAGADSFGTAHTRLLLSEANGGEDSGDLTDDRIVWDVRLKPGCLVNLAACSSANLDSGGAGLQKGLVPAFFIAGAGTVVANGWPISDPHSVPFQRRFYKNLSEGASPSRTLALTQRSAMTGELGVDLTEPGSWAGYVNFGPN